MNAPQASALADAYAFICCSGLASVRAKFGPHKQTGDADDVLAALRTLSCVYDAPGTRYEAIRRKARHVFADPAVQAATDVMAQRLLAQTTVPAGECHAAGDHRPDAQS